MKVTRANDTMNRLMIVIFVIFRTIDVLALQNSFECVKRKSGFCKAFNITEDFTHFIGLNYGNDNRISTIIEIDYIENQYSYELEKNKTKKKVDIVDNTVVDILLSEFKTPSYSYRIVLGEKLSRLAYVEIQEESRFINFNNYSPDLPIWPFAINVTIDAVPDSYNTNVSVYTKNGDGLDQAVPFLHAESKSIAVKYMSFRSRNKNVKLVGFYDCSTEFGPYCGIETTEIITDCSEKFAPLGSGLFNNFVDMVKFARSQKNRDGLFDFNEIFGIYRRDNDNMHIIFSKINYETGQYVRITIGDEITVRLRWFERESEEFIEKTAIKTGWNQAPSEPNFIRVVISSVTNRISIYNLDVDNNEPLLTMKLCNYFDNNDIQWMSVSSDGFKTVELYYDCCLPNQLDNCHVYNKTDNATTDMKENTLDSTTIRIDEEYTTMNFNETDTDMPYDSTDAMEITETTIEVTEEVTDTTMEMEVTTESKGNETEETEEEDDYEVKNYLPMELYHLNGVERSNTFLNTSNFHATGSTLYIYENGTSPNDYCPSEIDNDKLTQHVEAKDIHAEEEDPEVPIRSNLNDLLNSLIGK